MFSLYLTVMIHYSKFSNTVWIKTSRKGVRAYLVHTSMSCQWVVMVWYLFNTFCLK